MSLTDNNNGMVMPVSPMYGGGNTGFGGYAQQTFGCGCGVA